MILPSQLESATLRFDYRTDEITFGEKKPVTFEVAIARSDGFDSWNLEETHPLELLAGIHTETITSQMIAISSNTILQP